MEPGLFHVSFFELAHAFYFFGRTAAGKYTLQVSDKDQYAKLNPNAACTHGDNVGVVRFCQTFCGKGIVAGACESAWYLVRHHGNAKAGTADDDSSVIGFVRYLFSQIKSNVRVIAVMVSRIF